MEQTKDFKASIEYAEGAVKELKDQLAHAQSEKRKQKLRSKLAEWEKTLATLKEVKTNLEKTQAEGESDIKIIRRQWTRMEGFEKRMEEKFRRSVPSIGTLMAAASIGSPVDSPINKAIAQDVQKKRLQQKADMEKLKSGKLKIVKELSQSLTDAETQESTTKRRRKENIKRSVEGGQFSKLIDLTEKSLAATEKTSATIEEIFKLLKEQKQEDAATRFERLETDQDQLRMNLGNPDNMFQRVDPPEKRKGLLSRISDYIDFLVFGALGAIGGLILSAPIASAVVGAVGAGGMYLWGKLPQETKDKIIDGISSITKKLFSFMVDVLWKAFLRWEKELRDRFGWWMRRTFAELEGKTMRRMKKALTDTPVDEAERIADASGLKVIDTKKRLEREREKYQKALEYDADARRYGYAPGFGAGILQQMTSDAIGATEEEQRAKINALVKELEAAEKEHEQNKQKLKETTEKFYRDNPDFLGEPTTPSGQTRIKKKRANLSNFSGELPPNVQSMVQKLPANVIAAVKEYSQKYGLPEEIIYRQMYVESAGRQNAVSSAGAIGRMQLMPGTAKELGVNPYDDVENIEGGMRYLARMLDRYNGRMDLALAAYNAGPGRVDMAGGRIPNISETQNYVKKILGENWKQDPASENAGLISRIMTGKMLFEQQQRKNELKSKREDWLYNSEAATKNNAAPASSTMIHAPSNNNQTNVNVASFFDGVRNLEAVVNRIMDRDYRLQE